MFPKIRGTRDTSLDYWSWCIFNSWSDKKLPAWTHHVQTLWTWQEKPILAIDYVPGPLLGAGERYSSDTNLHLRRFLATCGARVLVFLGKKNTNPLCSLRTEKQTILNRKLTPVKFIHLVLFKTTSIMNWRMDRLRFVVQMFLRKMGGKIWTRFWRITKKLTNLKFSHSLGILDS